jgi:GNAT superfamily N-acetyltransferase
MGDFELRVAERSDVREAARVLARAFHADPAFSWILPAEETRGRHLRRFFATELRHESLRHGAVEVARVGGHIVGVDPQRRGRGVGAALLRSRLELCDQEGTAAYLESSNLENVPLYEHFGFQATGTLNLPAGAPVVTTMWRPAQNSEGWS